MVQNLFSPMVMIPRGQRVSRVILCFSWLKMRFTSGSGSEVQMGYAEGKSMLYLEARCIYITKAAGVQGLQNGSVSCIGVPSAVPSGIRAVLAENLICSSLDLECASSNDQTFTHSDMRRTARFLMQFLRAPTLSLPVFRCAELRQHVCWFKRRC